MSTTISLEDTRKMEPDYSQKCPVTEQEAIDTSWRGEMPSRYKKKKCFTVRVIKKPCCPARL